MDKIPTVQDFRRMIEAEMLETGFAQPTHDALAELENDHVFALIFEFLQYYNFYRTQSKETRQFDKHIAAVYLLEACQFWFKKGRSAIQAHPKHPVGGKQFVQFKPEVVGSLVAGLRDAAMGKVRRFYDMLDTDELEQIRAKLLQVGIGTINHDLEADKVKKRRVWLETDGARAAYKLRFRGGSAHRCLADMSVGAFTTLHGDSERGDGYQHFVMDQRGRIYCGFNRRLGQSDNFVHSSFVAGAHVMAAGMMRIDNGRIIGLRNDSGHYRPEGRHMALVLQRLRLYGAPLEQVVVEEINPMNGGVVATHMASEVLSRNGFPQRLI